MFRIVSLNIVFELLQRVAALAFEKFSHPILGIG
jgi:hypothetical protein